MLNDFLQVMVCTATRKARTKRYFISALHMENKLGMAGWDVDTYHHDGDVASYWIPNTRFDANSMPESMEKDEREAILKAIQGSDTLAAWV